MKAQIIVHLKQAALVVLSIAVVFLAISRVRSHQTESQIASDVPKLLISGDEKSFVQRLAWDLNSKGYAGVESKVIQKLLHSKGVFEQLETLSPESLTKDWPRHLTRLKGLTEELKMVREVISHQKKSALSETLSKVVLKLESLKESDEPRSAIKSVSAEIDLHIANEGSGLGGVVFAPAMALGTKSVPVGFGKKVISHFGQKLFTDQSTTTCTNVVYEDPSTTGDSLRGSDLFTERTSDVVELAQKLQTAAAIFQFVQRKIGTTKFFGATQTASQLLRSGAGTLADKSTLLIAMLREIGVPAVYRTGEVLVEEEKLKKLFKVQGSYDLFYALANSFPSAKTNGLIYSISGKRAWAMPHVWVRAFVDGQWSDIDTTDLTEDLSLTAPQLREVPISSNLLYWFFEKDAMGRFVKPGHLLNDVMRNAGLAIREQGDASSTISDVGMKQFGQSVLDSSNGIPLGTIGLVNPCVKRQSPFIPNEYQFVSAVRIGPENNPVLVFESPTAMWRGKTVSLMHTAGLLHDAGSNSVGQLQLSFDGKVVASGASTTGSALEVYHEIRYPSETPYTASRSSPGQTSGGVIVFNHALAPTVESDIVEHLKSIRSLVQNNASKQVQMASLLRLAGLFAQREFDDISRDGEMIRGIQTSPLNLMITSTNAGQVLGRDDRSYGIVPIGTAIDWLVGGPMYSKSGDKISMVDYSNVTAARAEIVISGSSIENVIWETLYGVPALSAVKILQTASQINFDKNLGLDFIKGEQLGVGNDAAIFSRLKKGMEGIVGVLNTPDYSGNKATLYSVTQTLVLDTGWSGVGFVAKSPTGPVIAGFNTYTYGVTGFGGGSQGAPASPVIEPVGSGATSPANKKGGVCGDPVSLSSGSMWQTYTDCSLKGRTAATELKFERTYLSSPISVTGDLGANWGHNWDTRLITPGSQSLSPNSGGNILWIDETGADFLMTRNLAPASDTFSAPTGFYFTLKEFADRYELRKQGNILFTFSRTGPEPAGRLKSISEPHGEKIDVAYNSSGQLLSVQTALAGQLLFSRDKLGRIASVIRVRDNLSYFYEYDSKGRLSSFTDFSGLKTKYEYNQDQIGTAANGLLSAVVDTLGRKTEFVYYDNGRVFEEREKGGAKRHYIYSPFVDQHLTRVKGPDGTMTEFRYDSKFRVVETVFPNRARTQSVWDAANNIIASTDELGFQTHFTYDSRGHMTGISKPENNGAYSTIEYDQTYDVPKKIMPIIGAPTDITIDPSTGDVLQVQRTDALGPLFLQYTYDNFGNVLQTTNNKSSYSNTVNSNGLIETVFDSRNPETRSYDNRARLKSKSFANGRLISFEYNDYDQVVQTTDSNGPTVFQVYDNAHRLISKTVTDNITSQTTTFEWDDNDLLIATTDPLGKRSVTQYAQLGLGCRILNLPTATIDSEGKVTRIEYDSMRLPVRKINPVGGITRYEYNLRGNLSAITDPSGARTEFRHDGNGRLVSQDRPTAIPRADGKPISSTLRTNFRYDDANRVVRTETVLGGNLNTASPELLVAESQYNAFDELTRHVLKKEKAGKILETLDDSSFSYQRQLDASLMATANNQVAQLSFFYENQPPFALTQEKVAATVQGNPQELIEGTLRLMPDVTGNIANVFLDANSLLTSTYDFAGRLKSVGSTFNGQNYLASISYDAMGRRKKITHSNGLVGSFEYDLLNRIKSLNWAGAGETFQENLQYSPVGNVISIVREFGSFNYTYDSTDQLTGTNYTGALSLPIPSPRLTTYDSAGNRKSDSLQGEVSVFKNVLLEDGTTIYAPDEDGLGQVVQKTDKVTGASDLFEFMGDRSLSAYRHVEAIPFQTETKSAKYYYDALGRRLAKHIQLGAISFNQAFLHLGTSDKILMATAGDSTATLYIDGVGADEHFANIRGQTLKTYISDHVGSVLNDKVASGISAFGPFGEILGNAPQISASMDPVMYGYTGRQYDAESNTYYYRARQYDQTVGRFMTTDPIGFSGGGSNLYQYALNTPLRYVDPSGLWPSEQYPSIQAAGYAAVVETNPASISQRQEYAGRIVQNPNKTYSYTEPNPGGMASASHGVIDTTTVGLYHTHGADDPGFRNEVYSTKDINNAYNSGLNSYLGTPAGSTQALNGQTGSLSFLSPQSQQGAVNACH